MNTSRNKKYLWYIPLTIVAIALIWIQVQTDLALPSYMQNIVNKGIMGRKTSLIYKYGREMLGISLLGMVATILISYFAALVSAGIAKDLRSDVFKQVEGYSLNEFDKFSTASLITRNTNDIQQITLMIFMTIRMVVSAPIMAVGGIRRAIDTSKSISWILAVSIPLSLVFIFIIILFMIPKFNSVQKLVDNLNLVSRQNLTGMRVIRAFRNEKYEEKRFDKANVDLTKTNLFINRMMSLMMPVTFFIIDLTQIGIVWFGAKKLNTGAVMIGDIMAFINYAMQVMFSFLMISMGSVILPRAIVSWKRVKEVLDTKASVTDNEARNDNNESSKASVEFKNVTFSYPGAEETVLDNISFKAQAGEVTAIIGSTGCGKSSLINLIPRFYDVTEGEVLVNDVNVKNYTQHQLHEKIGYVSQKAVLFSGTIESNIGLGIREEDDAQVQAEENDTHAEIERVSGIAQAKDFIEQKEDKYESEVAQGGTNFSGGQKQRISIARALARKAQIYIFDDSFSALDFKTDRALRKELAKYTHDAVTLIVAQRVSSIMDASQILVLDNGKIVGNGTHRQLLDNCEVYREIASSQLSKEELENGR